MIRIGIVASVVLFTSTAIAGCPGGVCNHPVRSLVAPHPTLARPVAPQTVSAGREMRVERSVVVRRGFARGPGLFARATFRPQRWR